MSIALKGDNQIRSSTSELIDGGEVDDPTPVDDDDDEDDGPGDDEDDDETDDEEGEQEEDDDDNETDDNETDDEEVPEWDQLIGYQEVIKIAHEKANGTVKEFELEEEVDSYIYEIELMNKTEKFEIEINA